MELPLKLAAGGDTNEEFAHLVGYIVGHHDDAGKKASTDCGIFARMFVIFVVEEAASIMVKIVVSSPSKVFKATTHR